MPQNLDQIDHPAEAPQVEELPEPVQIRIEEFIAEEPEIEEPIVAAAAIKFPHAFLIISEVSEPTDRLSSIDATDGSANANTEVDSSNAWPRVQSTTSLTTTSTS